MIPPFTYYVFSAILVLFGIRKCRQRTWGICNNNIKFNQKVAIVTGANSGIGYEIAKDLAKREAQVIMACRNLEEAAKAMCRIKRELNCSSVIIPMELDLASVRSIKNFADEIKSTYAAVNLLINNAGVSYPSGLEKKTKDGFEIHIGTNHLGHFLLTNLLLKTLQMGGGESRVVIISSSLYERGKLNLNDLNLERITEKTDDAYANSKLANVYFCRELAKRAAGISVYAVCPGWVYTNLFRHYKFKWYQVFLVLPIAFLFMRTAKQGAQTALYCATEPGLENESGSIYKDCKKYKSKVKLDDFVSQRLWEVSTRMIEEIDAKLTQTGLYNAAALM